MPSREASLRNSKVQSLAITQLTRKFNKRYKEIYGELRKEFNTTAAQGKARTKLTHEFPEDYRRIYLDIKADFLEEN